MAKDSFVYNIFGRSRRQVKPTPVKVQPNIPAGPVVQKVDAKRVGIDPTSTAAWILERFEGFTQIGEGTYGVVYKAFRTRDGVPVALKKIRLTTEGSDTLAATGVSTTAIREMLLLRGLRHTNIVELEDVYFTTFPSIQLWLIFEFCLMDLRQYVKFVTGAHKRNGSRTERALPMRQSKQFSRQILHGLHFCHAMNVLHRDMKPQNILLTLPSDALTQVARPTFTDVTGGGGGEDEDEFLGYLVESSPMAFNLFHNWRDATAKIADLGLARSNKLSTQMLTAEVITLWYRPPELLLGTPVYGQGVDIWSVGCILAEMVTGKALFPGDCEVGTLFKIFKLLGTPTAKSWSAGLQLPHFQGAFPRWEVPDRKAALTAALGTQDTDLVDLVDKCLQWEPSERISARDALNHPWFKSD